MNNFKKQNYIDVDRGVDDMNYQSDVAILNDF